jgi:hypothetical protein
MSVFVQIRPPVDPPAHPHWREALPLPKLPLRRMQEGHDHKVGLHCKDFYWGRQVCCSCWLMMLWWRYAIVAASAVGNDTQIA